MDKSEILDVVIVNFNAGSALSEAVGSLLEAEGVGVGITVVDNASHDDSMQLLRERIGGGTLIREICNHDNRGFAAACNQGLAAGRADLALLLNPDCRVEPETLRIVVETMETNPRVGMAGCLVLNPDGTEQRGCRRRLPRLGSSLRRVLLGRRGARRGFDLAGEPLPDEAVEVEAISGAFMLLRRAALEDAGLLDEQYFLHCEDLDLCRRFNDAGWKILFVPGARVWHQQGRSSGGRPVRVLWYKHRGIWRYFEKFDARHNSWPLNLAVRVGICLRALLLTPLVALRLLKP